MKYLNLTLRPNSMSRLALLVLASMLLQTGSANAESRHEKSEQQATTQQSKSISGTVVDDQGVPVIGANVSIKGTTQGAITDLDGKFILNNVSGNGTLVVSYVGFAKQEMSMTGKASFNIKLRSSDIKLEEVVVTALGLKREKKSLGYSVGEVKSEALNRVPQQDALNSLTGKVAGVQIANTSNDINAKTNVVIRGLTSLTGNNAPLVVLDGVPAGDAQIMKDLNPEDIENISVLKGPSAAALYGSRAGNGVILITSKSGKGGKKGVTVSVGYGASFAVPYKYINMQNRFTTGRSGQFNESNYQNWYGPEAGSTEKYVQWNTNGVAQPLTFYDNQLSDYFQTGISHSTDASVGMNFDKGSVRISYSNFTSDGVYPGVELKRNNVNLSGTYDLLKNLKLSTNIELSNPYSDNYPVPNWDVTQYMNTYQVPPHVNINDLKDYWIEENVLQRNVSTSWSNPWFAAYEQKSTYNRFRGLGNAKLEWEIIKDLKLMGRYSLAGYAEKNSYQQPWSSYGGDGGGQATPNGRYILNQLNGLEMNADVLLSYRKAFGKFEITPSIGGNIMRQRSYSMANKGDNLVIPGLYTVSNIQRGALSYESALMRKNIYSIYGTLGLSYNNMLFLDLTARNDWSSTLPINNRSYFYPSASLSALMNEILELPGWVSLWKLRGGYAQVGKDTDPYVIASILKKDVWGDYFTYSMPESLPNINLKPEIATSFEVGTDVSFFSNRIGLDFTYYIAHNKNQILSAQASSMSGYKQAIINAGNIENQGIEISLRGTPIQNKNLTWNVNVNFTRERSKLKELTQGMNRYQFWESTQVYAWTKVGESVGDIYTREPIRVKEGPYTGWPILSSNGKLQGNNTDMKKVGNFQHDFFMGLQSDLTWKNFTFAIGFDWRQGGEFYDVTMLRLARGGKVDQYRDGGSTFSGIIDNNTFNGDLNRLSGEIKSNPNIYQNNVWVGGRTAQLGGFPLASANDGSFYPGVISDGQGGYIENFGAEGTKMIPAWEVFSPSGGYWDTGIGNHWIYDASFIKLREVALSYTLPKHISKAIYAENISIGGFVKNILLWSAAGTNTDPESTTAFQDKKMLQGMTRWNGSPLTMSTGFKLNITF